jgi:methanethiol S-methyltransferase
MKTIKLLYGVIAYLLFFGTFLYTIGFVENMIVPKTIDGPGAATSSVPWLINLLFLGSFAIQHSVMARPAFKRWWTKYVSPEIERSTFVLLTCIILISMFIYWQPMTGVIWEVENATVALILTIVSFLGWGIVLLATFLINHFDLFGLRQVWLQFIDKPYTHLQFKKRSLYKLVRHPLMLGFLIAFWSTPHMTTGHLLFALATTGYILIALQLEERDLIKAHGEKYQAYRQEVPMLIPIPKAGRN